MNDSLTHRALQTPRSSLCRLLKCLSVLYKELLSCKSSRSEFDSSILPQKICESCAKFELEQSVLNRKRYEQRSFALPSGFRRPGARKYHHNLLRCLILLGQMFKPLAQAKCCPKDQPNGDPRGQGWGFRWSRGRSFEPHVKMCLQKSV